MGQQCFYITYYVTTQQYENAIKFLEQQLSIENLDNDTRLRAEKALDDLKTRLSEN